MRTLDALRVFAFAACIAAASPAVAVSDFDGEFIDGDWVASILAQQGPPASFVAAREEGGGNLGAYRQLAHGYGGPGSIITGHLRLGAVYDPAARGALAQVDMAFDLWVSAFGTVRYGALLEQGGSFFQSTSEEKFFDHWTSHALDDLTATDFVQVGGTSNPDFSAGGAPMTFGYYASNGTDQPEPTSTLSGLDNWSVNAVPVPEPETYALLLAGLGLLGFAARRRREG